MCQINGQIIIFTIKSINPFKGQIPFNRTPGIRAKRANFKFFLNVIVMYTGCFGIRVKKLQNMFPWVKTRNKSPKSDFFSFTRI